MSEQPAPYTCKHGCERDALKDEIDTLRAGIEQLKRERDAAREALREQLDECFDDRCEMCARHETLIRDKDADHG